MTEGPHRETGAGLSCRAFPLAFRQACVMIAWIDAACRLEPRDVLADLRMRRLNPTRDGR